MTIMPVITVLGMHRSGTSVLAALVESLGVHMGTPDEFLTALPENARGYWEHRGIRDLNEELLRRLHGSWHTPPVLPHGWEHVPALDDLRVRARTLVSGLAGHGHWGWKDPRACILLPFWQLQMPPMHHVISLRNPVDVAQSLARRDDLPFDHGVRLWLVHYACALAAVGDAPCLMVPYDALLDNPASLVDRLRSFVGTGTTRPPGHAIVSPSLRHHLTPDEDVARHPGVPAEIRGLYAGLVQAAHAQPDGVRLHAAAAVGAMRRLAEADVSRGDHAWFVQFARGYGAAAPLPEAFGHARPDSAARQHVRAFLSGHPLLGRAYRAVRRRVRRTLELGP